jgi:hypothetical protein
MAAGVRFRSQPIRYCVRRHQPYVLSTATSVPREPFLTALCQARRSLARGTCPGDPFMIAFRSTYSLAGGFVAGTSLDTETTAVLKDLLVRCRNDVWLDARLDATLNQWAIEARTAGMRPEQMVVALKGLWYKHAVHDLDLERDVKGHTLLGVLGTALTAFFADANARAAEGRPAR